MKRANTLFLCAMCLAPSTLYANTNETLSVKPQFLKLKTGVSQSTAPQISKNGFTCGNKALTLQKDGSINLNLNVTDCEITYYFETEFHNFIPLASPNNPIAKTARKTSLSFDEKTKHYNLSGKIPLDKTGQILADFHLDMSLDNDGLINCGSFFVFKVV